MPIADMTEEQLQRALQLLGEAQSALTQCCWVLGELRTNRILRELSGVEQEVLDKLDVHI